MKRVYVIFTFAAAAIFSAHAQSVVIDSAAVGPAGQGWPNEVYYNIPTYTGYPVASDWDIAVSVQPSMWPNQTLQATSVRINGGRYVHIFKIHNADSTGFNTVFNPATDSVNWQPLHDSPTSWDMGALNRTLNGSNPYDYGWGTYNTLTHHIQGDSLYAIRTLNGQWKKLRINKLSYDTTWYLTFADMNGANLTQISINKQSYPGKNFVYVSLASGLVMDKEPAAWDLLFTRYVDWVSNPMGTAWYPVNGVLMNKGVEAVKAHPVDISSTDFGPFAGGLSNDINTIGWNWKTFVAPVFVIEDSTVYYIKARDNNIYRLRFLNYKSSNVETVFELLYIQPASVNGVDPMQNVLVFPNPTSRSLQVVDLASAGATQYRIVNATGAVLANGLVNASTSAAVIDVSHLPDGLFFIQLIQNGSTATRSFVVNR